MKAIILAAGRGSRLKGAAGDNPKCLAKAGEYTLIQRQIMALRTSGIEDIIAVVGYGAEKVRRECGPEIEYIDNPIFYRTSSLYSLWLARDRLEDGFVVLNSDVLFHPQLLMDLISARYEDALLISYSDGSAPLGDEEMKVRVRGGRVVDISKSMEPSEADGENVGIVKFGRDGASILSRQIQLLVSKGAYQAWAPLAFREFALSRSLRVVGTRGFPWIEIDFPEDYHRAVNEILPQIEESAWLVEPRVMAAKPADELTFIRPAGGLL
jgi:choline kinase